MKRVIRILAFVLFWMGAPAVADDIPNALQGLWQPAATTQAVAAEK
jgi:hypothetical protein